MLRRNNSVIGTALCTGVALIAFAFYQRYEGPLDLPATSFYIAAAIICVLPAVYARLRQKPCRKTGS